MYYLFVVYCVLLFFFFFFKQKTAYEMCISDWSSDVCSSDLTCLEIGQGGLVGEVVVLQQRGDARLVQIRREQLGQRRGYRLEQRVLAHETHIGVDGEAGGGKNALERAHALLVEADAFGQDQPAVDAAAPLRGSIVVDDAADP